MSLWKEYFKGKITGKIYEYLGEVYCLNPETQSPNNLHNRYVILYDKEDTKYRFIVPKSLFATNYIRVDCKINVSP